MRPVYGGLVVENGGLRLYALFGDHSRPLRPSHSGTGKTVVLSGRRLLVPLSGTGWSGALPAHGGDFWGPRGGKPAGRQGLFLGRQWRQVWSRTRCLIRGEDTVPASHRCESLGGLPVVLAEICAVSTDQIVLLDYLFHIHHLAEII